MSLFFTDPDCINQVKQIFGDLDLPDLYSHHEKETYDRIKLQIDEFMRFHNLPENILIKTSKGTFNRT